MIRIAFLLNFPKSYKGGINYIKNLLYATSLLNSDKIKYILFVPNDIEQEYIDLFSPYAEIVKTTILKRYSPQWFIDKVLEKKLNTNFFLANLLKKYKINIISHSNFYGKLKDIKVINWIPDLQILHYPDLWSESDRKKIFKQYGKIVDNSDRIVLSSNDAFKDFKNFTLKNWDKVRVLQFVSQPDAISNPEFESIKEVVKAKYKIGLPFFYLPNQFWSHKNHITVFKATKILRDKGLNPLLVTTGFMADYRSNSSNNVQTIKNYINNNNLSDNILLLGLIPYNEVLVLIRMCVCLINPSLFEGWSSTVEEAKSTGKQIILSNIPIHKEQNPKDGIYFDPLNEYELAGIMETLMLENNKNDQTNFTISESVKADLIARTTNFAKNYFEIVNELVP